MVDIDPFKRLNDQHGHAGGDVALSSLGKTARLVLRATDDLGLWGGEEFLLVQPDCSLVGGNDVAQRFSFFFNCAPDDLNRKRHGGEHHGVHRIGGPDAHRHLIISSALAARRPCTG